MFFFCQFKILGLFLQWLKRVDNEVDARKQESKPLRSRVRSSSYYRPARYNPFNIRSPTCWNYSLYFHGSVVEPVLTCHWFQRSLEMYGPFMWPNVGSSGFSDRSGGLRCREWQWGKQETWNLRDRLLLVNHLSVTYFYIWPGVEQASICTST